METEQRGDENLIAKANLKRARTTAIVFGVISGLALITLVYAFVQQGVAKEQARVAQELQIKLDNCAQEAAKQMKLAELAAEEANRQRAMAIEAMSKAKK